MSGPRVRTDIAEVFVVRDRAELLLLRRAQEPMYGTWQPVFGHIESGETSVAAARRELGEETGAAAGAGLVSLVPLEGVRPYYLAESDEIVASPRFVAMVVRGWEPRLCEEHDASRWVPMATAGGELHWPSQRESWAEALDTVLAAR